MTHDSGIPPEEKEKWSLDRERDADALNDYVKVERVIGQQLDEDGETEYLVKCMPLSPDDQDWYANVNRERAIL